MTKRAIEKGEVVLRCPPYASIVIDEWRKVMELTVGTWEKMMRGRRRKRGEESGEWKRMERGRRRMGWEVDEDGIHHLEEDGEMEKEEKKKEEEKEKENGLGKYMKMTYLLTFITLKEVRFPPLHFL